MNISRQTIIPVRFIRESATTTLEGLIVRYKYKGFEINASKEGVSSMGYIPMITTLEEFNIISDCFYRAFLQHHNLLVYNSLLSESELDIVIMKAQEISKQIQVKEDAIQL